jgi:hypothetical protein
MPHLFSKNSSEFLGILIQNFFLEFSRCNKKSLAVKAYSSIHAVMMVGSALIMRSAADEQPKQQQL